MAEPACDISHSLITVQRWPIGIQQYTGGHEIRNADSIDLFIFILNCCWSGWSVYELFVRSAQYALELSCHLSRSWNTWWAGCQLATSGREYACSVDEFHLRAKIWSCMYMRLPRHGSDC